jgi:hypothetical protein
VQVQIRRALVGTGRAMRTVELAGWAYARARVIEGWHLGNGRRAADPIAIPIGRVNPGGLLWALKPDPSDGKKRANVALKDRQFAEMVTLAVIAFCAPDDLPPSIAHGRDVPGAA